MTPFRRTLIWCAGASSETLAACPEQEQIRYESIGGTVLLTGMFAAFSGGYAVLRISHSAAAAVVVGLIWGVAIFNLDRIFVSGFRARRQRDSRWITFARALPRIALAVVIALVISKPIEVRIVEDRLNAELIKLRDRHLVESNTTLATAYGTTSLEQQARQSHNQAEALAQKRDGVPESPLYQRLVHQRDECNEEAARIRRANETRISSLAGDIYKLKVQIDEADEVISRNSRIVARSTDPSEAATAQEQVNRARGTRTRAAAQRTTLKARVTNLREEFARKETQCKRMDEQVDAEEARYRQELDQRIGGWKDREIQATEKLAEANIKIKEVNVDDAKNLGIAFSRNFVAQIEALAELERSRPAVRNMGLLLWALFTLLECAPIIVKLLTPAGPYDAALDAEERRFYSKNGNL